MDRILKLNDMQLDALREIGNIGVGNAATDLSRLINRKIQIVVPDTKFIPVKRFSYELGGPEKLVTSIYLQISGDLHGEAMFLFTESNSLHLVDLLNGKEIGTTKTLDDMSMSALLEMTNIFAGSYLTALSNMFSLSVLPGVPHATYDMVQAVLDFLLAKVSGYAENILTVKTRIEIEGVDVNGEFMLFLEIESYRKMLKILQDKYGLAS